MLVLMASNEYRLFCNNSGSDHQRWMFNQSKVKGLTDKTVLENKCARKPRVKTNALASFTVLSNIRDPFNHDIFGHLLGLVTEFDILKLSPMGEPLI